MKTNRILPFLLSALLAVSAHASLILHYTLDEGSGLTAANTGSASGADATLNGSGSGWTTDTPDGSGYAYTTGSGANSYLSAGVVEELHGVTDFTASFWIKVSGVSSADRLFSTRGISGGYIDLYAKSASTPNALELEFQFTDGVNSRTINFAAFDASDWVFVSVVRSGAGAILYVGDAENAIGSVGVVASSGTQSGAVNQNSGAFEIGGTAASTSDRSPAALFSDFRFYDEALTSAALDGIRASVIPEPAAAGLLIGAFAGLAGLLRRRR